MALRGSVSIAFLAAGLLSVAPKWTLAQTSSVVCLSEFAWMYNSLEQSPCTVAAYLQAACNNGQFTYNPLPEGYHYIGPYADENNVCQCSTVTYNTVSACGLCQNRTIISWDAWDYNCTEVYPGLLPSGVPGTTAVPQWAFQNVTISDLFNATLALAVGDAPESTLIHAQSTGTAAPTSTGGSVITSTIGASVTVITSSPSSTFSGGTTNSSTDTGAIAGGVVGGVVGLALIAGAAIFILRKKKRSQIAPSTQYAASTIPSSPGFTEPTSINTSMTQPKFYNPNDPSTFPSFTGQYTGAPQV